MAGHRNTASGRAERHIQTIGGLLLAADSITHTLIPLHTLSIHVRKHGLVHIDIIVDHNLCFVIVSPM